MRVNHSPIVKNGIIEALCSITALVFVVASPRPGTLSSPAESQAKDTLQAKATQVLEKARRATTKDLGSPRIEGLIINSVTDVSYPYPESVLRTRPQFRNQRMLGEIDKEVGLRLPDEFREIVDARYPTNQWISNSTLSGHRFAEKSEVLVDGKPVNVAGGATSARKSQQERIAEFKDSIFLTVFPISLDYSWHPALEFIYIGVAESADTKADVIEIVLPNGMKFQFFFDWESHLLLMVIETVKSRSSDKEIERRHFYSDYRKSDGLLVAHKVVTELNREVTEERRIERLQVNPAFKPGYFDVKGE